MNHTGVAFFNHWGDNAVMKAIDIAVDCLGGVGKLAAAIGVSQAAVSNWRARGSSPDAIHCTAIERATGGAVTRRDLRPDDWHLIWPELATEQEVAHG